MAAISTAVAAATLAIVAQDATTLRAAPRDAAAAHAQLVAGDALEIRGERGDYLQVYDHRRERAGYVRATQVRTLALTPTEAPALAAVMRFLKDTPGQETLAIAYSAAYLRAAPREAIDGAAFDVLGTAAERLAQRASDTARLSKAQETKLNAEVEAAAAYGVRMTSIERDGRIRLCYDGEAFRRVLALPATTEARARAALALTDPECIDPAMLPAARRELDDWRNDTLAKVEVAAPTTPPGASTDVLPNTLRQRVQMRRAAVWSSIAFHRVRESSASASTNKAQAAAQEAARTFASIDRAALDDRDQVTYADAAIRVSAVRPLIDVVPVKTVAGKALAKLVTHPGEPGQTCMSLHAADGKPTAQRCTWGIAYVDAANVNASGDTITLPVQPLDGWRELWVWRKRDGEWSVTALPPGTSTGVGAVGYVEFAGWVPGGKQMLVARETRSGERTRRTFETISLDSLATERAAEQPNALSTFYRWQDAAWKRNTLALR